MCECDKSIFFNYVIKSLYPYQRQYYIRLTHTKCTLTKPANAKYHGLLRFNLIIYVNFLTQGV